MAFPQSILGQKGELNLAGTWTDVTSYIYTRDGVSVRRGRSDEAGQVDPSSCRFTVDNRDGRWSPRNPRGAWYGSLTRNIGYRHSVNLGTSRLWNPARAVAGSYCSAPDSAGLSVTGDIDLRFDVDLGSWRETTLFLAKRASSTSQISYGLYVLESGLLGFFWSTAGTSGTRTDVTSTVPVPWPDCGRKAVRVTFDVNNGAGGNTATFYTSDTLSGTWTALGDAVVTAGVTSIFDGTSDLYIGPDPTSTSVAPMTVYAAAVYNGIAGSLVASPDFTGQTGTVASVTDAQGNVWTTAGDAVISTWRTRFCGELSQFPIRWDTSGTDVYVPLEASGLLRRLQQGSSPLRSALYRYTLQDTSSLLAYWPMEDQTQATRFGTAATGGSPLKVVGSAVAFADSEVFQCSAALPTFSTARMLGAVKANSTTGELQLRWLISVPSAGLTNGAEIISFTNSGTAARWAVTYATGGDLNLSSYDTSGALIGTAGPFGFGMNGTDSLMTLTLVQNGADVDWELSKYAIGSTSVGLNSGTLAARTIAGVTRVDLNRDATLGTVVMGHVAVLSTATQPGDLFEAVNAYLGERAGTRIERLCEENGIPFRRIGDHATSTMLGYQGRDTLVDLLREAANADEGFLYELRDVAGFAYKSGRSLCAQDPRVTLDYSLAHLDDFQPTDDDQAVRNDVTVTRDGGASARAVQATGSLGTATVGTYDTSDTLSLAYDDEADDHANWRLHVGTVDETRFPSIGVRLENTRIAASASLTTGLLDLDLGETLSVTNPPEWLPAVTVREVVQGITETISQNYSYAVGMNCTPASVYDVGVLATSSATTGDRVASGYTTLTADITSGATSFQITTTAGAPLWSTTASGYDVMVGGERMTVTSITGGSSPQTANVTRGVNGVTVAHTAGDVFDIADPTYLGL